VLYSCGVFTPLINRLQALFSDPTHRSYLLDYVFGVTIDSQLVGVVYDIRYALTSFALSIIPFWHPTPTVHTMLHADPPPGIVEAEEQGPGEVAPPIVQ
jgi:hypothetical protein